MVSVLAVILFAANVGAAPFATGQAASLAIGQPNMTFSGVNATPGVGASGISSSSGVWTDGTLLIVADSLNNRVLLYNTIPVANGTPADVIIGQPDSASSLPNQGGAAAANTLSIPSGVFFDGLNLYIADTGNNRVLIYSGLPIDNNTPANFVVGQAGMAGAASNRGGTAGANTLSQPLGVYSDSAALYVADSGNHRVLIYSPIPSANNAAASVVVGQAAMTGQSANRAAAVSSVTLSFPSGVWADPASLYVADQMNNRVLIYSPIPAANNAGASVVLGQVLFSSAAANQGGAVGASTLFRPNSVFSDGTKLIVSDKGNNRVLIYNTIAASNNAAANVALGQPNLQSNNVNQGRSSPSAASLFNPAMAMSAAGALFIADQLNNRVLIYNQVPGASGVSADVAVGQADMTTGFPNQASTLAGPNTAFRPTGAFFDGSRFFVADRSNQRVLIFNSAPTTSNAGAFVVVGQALMSSSTFNQGGAPAANTLANPSAVFSDKTKLFIADSSNNRILIYNAIPSANNSAANVVVGQSTMNLGGANRGGAPTASTLSFPGSVQSDGIRLIVADRSNNRVLIYSPVPSANNAAASVVVGQVSLSTNLVNQGGSVGPRTLNSPNWAYSDGPRLFIADQLNNRVLIYNSIPNSNNAPASVVVGQPNMTSALPNQGAAPSAQTLLRPSGVYSDGTALYVVDQGNNRVLVYNTIPTSNNAAADAVIGQPTFVKNRPNQAIGGANAATLFAPQSLMVDNATARMFVTDTNNNRTLMYLPAASTNVSTSGGALTLYSPIGPSQVDMRVPVGAFAQNTTVTLSVVATFTNSPSPAAALSGTGLGVQVDSTLQPAAPVQLALSYRLSDVTGFDRTKLALARYDAPSDTWVPLPSVSDTQGNQVVAFVDHFSIYQIMQVDASASTVKTVVAFPNPLRPSAGQTAMTFGSAPANARIRIYSLGAVLVKDLSADATGLARWDGTNISGMSVASGIYLVLVQGGGRSATFKVAVER